MRWDTCLASAMASLATVARADPTWPASTDELEEIMYQVSGFRARQFGGTVIPCNNKALGPGRNGPGEWIRSAFHDIATTRIANNARVGGMDGSLQFELNSGENTGQAFTTTLVFMKDYFTLRSSIADLLSLGVYYATRSCGGPAVPVRGGRIDATAGLGAGFIPLPGDPPLTFQSKFQRMGFSLSEAIELTTCGHTVGSIHAANSPNVIDPSDPLLVNGAIGVDSTSSQFDNMNAIEYLAWNSTSPLINGKISTTQRKTNSDTKLYLFEGNVTITAVAQDDPTSYNARCSRVFQKMIEVVPAGVVLTDPITPYFVKPVNLALALNSGADSLQLTGFIRVRTTGLSADPVTGVSITYQDRNGGSSCGVLGCTFKLNKQGLTKGFDDTFDWYPISGQIPTASGISSFTITVTTQSGRTQTLDNNGQLYPMQDKAILMQTQSCFLSSGGSSGQLTITAAIRNDRLGMPATSFISFLQDTGNANLPVPKLQNATVTLTQGRCAGYYTVYTASYTIPGSYGYAARLDVISGSGPDIANDDFNSVTLLTASCASFTYPQQSSCSSTLPSGGSSSSSVASSTSASTSSVVSSVSSTSSGTASSGTISSSSLSTSSGSTSSSVSSSSSSSDVSSSSSSSSSVSSSSTISSVSSSASSSSVSSSFSSDVSSPSSSSNAVSSLSSSSTSSGTVSSSASSSSSSSDVSLSSSTTSSWTVSNSVSSTLSSTSSGTSSSGTASSSSSTSSGSATASTTQTTTSSATGTSSSAPATSPHHRATMGGYAFVGCQTEGTGVRALAAKNFAYDGMTLESCMQNCTGYNYWGTEYGRECYCGNSLAATSTTADLSDCNMLCSGDQTQYCGAGNRLELYLTTSVPTPTATLIHKPTVSPYTRKGCYTELENSRALPNSALSNDQMTNEMCASHCKNYPWFATQYAKECYCGDSLDPRSTQAPDDQCNMPCAGNQFQYCGGPSRLELYFSSSVRAPSLPQNITTTGEPDGAHSGTFLWSLVGCYTEATGIRALSDKAFFAGTNSTLDRCASSCLGFAYFGAEYGDECYCGNELNNGSVPVAASECNMLCPGNELQYCGAGNRLSLYQMEEN
ncbi:uncharacterized protein B0I36DRAFT_105145 [Microdochium trichocladiopsis]|uniref:Heme peroxidase n=1 Tax=Microdochium trichocladiopsis TaxID=1682393 RepID=A0A9P8YBK4_9PEZI|nr:uncharacterized protein B0I36DRAFT_105145 [Microdochium trichocladiopsis]KAH7033113.1 hypothetical protein B0I36DRAFT_105145 [Microdochium trichocladiopsis]